MSKKAIDKTGLNEGDYSSSDLGYEGNTAGPGKEQFKIKNVVGADVHPSNLHTKGKGPQGSAGSTGQDSCNAGDYLSNNNGVVNGDPEKAGS